jgi:AAA domain
VIVDRTNFDLAQRQSFLKLAEQQGVPAHCVLLHLDVSVCVKRAIDRTDHEGGLQVCVVLIHSDLMVDTCKFHACRFQQQSDCVELDCRQACAVLVLCACQDPRGIVDKWHHTASRRRATWPSSQ